MYKILFDNKINLIFLLISLGSIVFLLGIDSSLVTSTQWIHHRGSDISLTHMGWFFFKNDLWRFPLGSNPNYGDGIGSSIVFSDSIPILALLFKFISPVLPDNFQYISIWYFMCFFLQMYFSYKILNEFTKNNIFLSSALCFS